MGEDGTVDRGCPGRHSTVHGPVMVHTHHYASARPAEPHSTREPCCQRCDLVNDRWEAHFSLLHFTELPRGCIFYKRKARPSISKKVMTGSGGVLASSGSGPEPEPALPARSACRHAGPLLTRTWPSLLVSAVHAATGRASRGTLLKSSAVVKSNV